MKVEMRHLLARRLPDGMPHTYALAGERVRHSARNVSDSGHQGCPRVTVKLPNVWQVRSWHNQDVARVELTCVHKCHGQCALSDEAGRRLPGNDLAEDASVRHKS